MAQSQEQVVFRGLATETWTAGADVGKLERTSLVFEVRAWGAQ